MTAVMQLELDITTPVAAQAPAAEAMILTIARITLSTTAHPGYAEFTTGTVAATSGNECTVITTDSVWAASAIRDALLDAGYALDADPHNERTTITVWAPAMPTASPPPAMHLTNHTALETGTEFLLQGPGGCVEQQCGAGLHNALIVHARHPHPGAVRGTCTRHGATCWTRCTWPHVDRVRHLLAEGSSAWHITPAAERQMRDLYLRHIHATRPTH